MCAITSTLGASVHSYLFYKLSLFCILVYSIMMKIPYCNTTCQFVRKCFFIRNGCFYSIEYFIYRQPTGNIAGNIWQPVGPRPISATGGSRQWMRFQIKSTLYPMYFLLFFFSCSTKIIGYNIWVRPLNLYKVMRPVKD